MFSIEKIFTKECNRWFALSEPTEPKSKDYLFLSALYIYLRKNNYFDGTASNLIKALKSVCDESFHPNRVTRNLLFNGYELKKQGINFDYKRIHSGRKIILNLNCVSSDSNIIVIFSVTLVPIKSLASPYNA